MGAIAGAETIVAGLLSPATINLTGQVDPTGVAEAGVTINAAIASLGASGGVVLLPANPAGGQASFKCNEPIVIGNGTSSAASTVNGVRLVGVGNPGINLANTPQTRLFAGQALSQLLVIQGPCFGNGAANLYLDPNGLMTAGTMLTVTSGQTGRFSDITLKVPGSGVGILENCVGGGVGNQNTMHNKWDGIYVTFANANTSTAWNFSAAATTFNTCYEELENIYIAWGAAAAAQTITAFAFSGCDNIRLRDIHLNAYTAGSGTNRIFFDYSVVTANNKPSDVLMDGIDFGSASTVFANSGTAPSATAKPNRVAAPSATNGQPANPNLPNLGWGWQAARGQATLVAGTVSVVASLVTTNSIILVTPTSGGTTTGIIRVGTITAGTGFTITSTVGTDTSVVDWVILDPA